MNGFLSITQIPCLLILKESELCVDHHLACIDADISHLSAALRQLREKCHLLREAKHNHRAALSPASILPPELLIDILFCAESDPIDIFNTSRPAWAISKVCQLWRSIITVHCPKVWTKISVLCISERAEMLKDDALLSVLETVFSRSQNHKLDITMEFDFTCDESHPVLELQNDIWDALTLHVERWEKLYIFLHPIDMHVLGDLRGRLSSLKEDGLQYSSPTTAPRLESFKYRVELCDDEEWDTGDGIPLEYLFNIIRNSPKLAAIDICCQYSSYDTVSPHISKPLLSKLVVNNTVFLRSLSVTALKEATLISDSYVQPESPSDFLADFHDLLVESRCSTLNYLNISIDLLNQHLLSNLQLASALTSFNLCQYTWNDQDDMVMWEFIVQLADMKEFIPHLEEVELNLPIRRKVDIRFADRTMVKMVEARRHLSLRKFGLIGDYARFCNLTGDDIEELKALQADGLDVTLLGTRTCDYSCDPLEYDDS
ncbi:uncharacterized protein BT62DRAFT_993878 [Guyanagaster necrorhizus]|uniref:F-box domain-containing protein n=1 Tax=Guyanagaster necrorhizus TaxID=856835 RepID=A0A9P7VTD0_9AGAR|nr:uncharacterized protein BT62DRAFT_993878 [Guyanagaster necrorhizus MCA 3950]KAG7447058.1 hypothetical protein BT62DRAFT_993878 [Guyanagaster necrorhizus MCA 3950]